MFLCMKNYYSVIHHVNGPLFLSSHAQSHPSGRISFPYPFSPTKRLVPQSLLRDACISVLTASGTSMLESGLQDHEQGTQRPTQSPTQCHRRELQAHQTGAIMCSYPLPYSPFSLEEQTRRGSRAKETTWIWRPVHRRILATSSELVALAARSDLAEEAALEGLEVCVRARLLGEASGDAYQFTHDLIREVVLADLSTAGRGEGRRSGTLFDPGSDAGAAEP